MKVSGKIEVRLDLRKEVGKGGGGGRGTKLHYKAQDSCALPGFLLNEDWDTVDTKSPA